MVCSDFLWNREATQFFDWLASRHDEIFIVFKNTVNVLYGTYENSVSSLRMETQETNEVAPSNLSPQDAIRKLVDLRNEQVSLFSVCSLENISFKESYDAKISQKRCCARSLP